MMEVCMSGPEEPKVEWWHSFMTAYLLEAAKSNGEWEWDLLWGEETDV